MLIPESFKSLYRLSQKSSYPKEDISTPTTKSQAKYFIHIWTEQSLSFLKNFISWKSDIPMSKYCLFVILWLFHQQLILKKTLSTLSMSPARRACFLWMLKGWLRNIVTTLMQLWYVRCSWIKVYRELRGCSIQICIKYIARLFVVGVKTSPVGYELFWDGLSVQGFEQLSGIHGINMISYKSLIQ